jgi:hypothetical protein
MIGAVDKKNYLTSEISQLKNFIQMLEQDNKINRRQRIGAASIVTSLMTGGTVLFFYFLNPIMSVEENLEDQLKLVPVNHLNSTCCDLSGATDVHHGRDCCNDLAKAYAFCLQLCEELDSRVGSWQLIYFPAAFTLLMLTMFVCQAAYGFIFSEMFCNEKRHLSEDTQAVIAAADFEWLQADWKVSDILHEAKNLLVEKKLQYKNQFGDLPGSATLVIEEEKVEEKEEKKIYAETSNRYPLWGAESNRELSAPLLGEAEEKEYNNGYV